MKRYCIGDVIVDIDVECERLERLGKPYEVDVDGPPNMRVIITKEMLDDMHKEYNYLTRDEVAYLASGALFNRRITAFNGLMLHSSAIAMDGRAYLFSAHSGTGKSTHTGLWKQVFGDRVTYINDDKPIIRKIDGKFYAYGTPWSGKTDLNTNIKVPLAAIVFIERGDTNSITPIDPAKEAVAVPMLEQTPRPRTPQLLAAMLNTADDLLLNTPLFKLHCNISEDAVYTSYNTLKNC
ncbi:MAG: hypothetical protein IIW03_04325 [Clostridia bacterium]|nr:hypothetical protein [Clostridia bacterium]